MFFYILYKLGYVIANILPLRLAYRIAEAICYIQYCIAKKDREAVTKNLSIVLKKDTSQCHGVVRQVYRNFGLYLVDFFRMRRIDRAFVKKRVRIEGIANLNEALKQKKGVIALTCHIGSWEMGGIVVAAMGYDINAVVLNHKYRNIDNFFIRQREKKGMKVITISSSMRKCVSVLKKNGILALLGDRDFANSGVVSDFFGMPTRIPKGPALFSLMTGAAILPSFFLREKRFNYRFIFEKPIWIDKGWGADKYEIIKRTTDKLVSVMEVHIKEHPEQWLIFRRFWESPADAFVI